MQTQTSNTLHNAIMEAGSKDRPPMLAPGNYVQWKSRIKRYIDTKPNHELIHYCLENPPYKLDWKDIEVPVSEGKSLFVVGLSGEGSGSRGEVVGLGWKVGERPVKAAVNDSSIVSPSTPPGTVLNLAEESCSTWLDYVGPLITDELDSKKRWSYRDPDGNVQGSFSLA
nr:ribonuclease H-like domain-containing protein [Tanacetum cinerariifolium]